MRRSLFLLLIGVAVFAFSQAASADTYQITFSSSTLLGSATILPATTDFTYTPSTGFTSGITINWDGLTFTFTPSMLNGWTGGPGSCPTSPAGTDEFDILTDQSCVDQTSYSAAIWIGATPYPSSTVCAPFGTSVCSLFGLGNGGSNDYIAQTVSGPYNVHVRSSSVCFVGGLWLRGVRLGRCPSCAARRFTHLRKLPALALTLAGVARRIKEHRHSPPVPAAGSLRASPTRC
jgi:hypothetical protein